MLFTLLYYIGFVAALVAVGLLVGDNIFERTITTVVIFAGVAVITMPSISVQVRRLHDLNCRGWWYCLNFVPVIGGFAGIGLMVFFMFPGTKGENRFGPRLAVKEAQWRSPDLP